MLPTSIRKQAWLKPRPHDSSAWRACLAIGTLAALAISAAPAVAARRPPARALYVAPSGNDANPGTRNAPVRTLRHVRDLVRAMNGRMTGDIVVHLAGGVYRLTQPLRFSARDSGTNGHDIIYAALPGQRPILSGAVRVTGWRQVDARRNLWAAPAPAPLANTRQLYINGVRAARARGPLPVALQATPTGYLAAGDALAGWRNPGDIEFVYTGGNALWSAPSVGLGAWTEPRCPIAAIQGAVITMAEPCWQNSTRRVMLPPDSGFHRTANLVGPASIGKAPAYVENAYELLGTPGQWYFDRTARRIFYTPRRGENLATADVEAPVLEALVLGAGTPDAPMHNVVFKGLEFAYATWLAPSGPEGFSAIQANYQVTGPHGFDRQALCTLAPQGTCPYGAWTPAPANVAFLNDRNMTFVRDAFVHLGAAGLALGDGSQSDTVAGCVFTDISGNGLELGGVDQPQAPPGAQTRGDRILDNHFYAVAVEYHGGVGIDVGYARDIQIAHNQLDHLPYTAISMGWGGWPDKIHQAGVANYSQHNVIADNLIFDHMLLLADGGAIYTQGLTGPSLAAGERVEGNVIYDQLGSGHAIYTDNGSSNITVHGNVVVNADFDDWGSRHRDYYPGDSNVGRDYDPLAITDNYWQQGDPDSDRGQVLVARNHLIRSLRQAPAALLRQAGLEPAYADLLRRHMSPPSAPAPPQRLAVWAGGGVAYVSWNPPVFTGGAPVRQYTVLSSGGQRAMISAAEFQHLGYVRLGGLTAGRAYTFTVTAQNVYGFSSPSLPATVTPNPQPAPLPGPPARVWAELQGSRASVHFRAPTLTRGAPPVPITAYRIHISPGGGSLLFTGRTAMVLAGHTTFAVVTGLTPGVSYRFGVAAVTPSGEGPVTWSPAPGSGQAHVQ